ncbi:hypothetical protein [Amycolatopsis sp. NPDC058986]|uniref:hypothetical protein n=1 Tax=unclassified Amycolatopsis TaxID=2618356 RepID=UPI00366F341E
MKQPHWIGDGPLPETSRMTYLEAVQSLENLIRARRDVRLDWSGGRGPRSDARVVFLATAGIPEHRVRFRSPQQIGALARILGSARPLPDHQGLWSERERTITARVVGDHDELVLALARIMTPKTPDDGVLPDSPLGQDVRDRLASSGVFLTSETAAGPKPGRRTMRLVAADDELMTLYPRRFRTAPTLALALTGFEAAAAKTAQELLVGYGAAYLHEVVQATGVSLRLWEEDYPSDRRSAGSGVGKIGFPRERYDVVPVSLYAAANSPGRDLPEKYVKYYQVLEYFMPRAAAAVGGKVRSEVDRLHAIAGLAITPSQIAGFLRGNDLLTGLSDDGLIRDVPVLRADTDTHPVPGLDYRPDVVKRVYRIRCRIGQGGRDRTEAIRPYSREARDLGADLRLIRFFAERAIQHWSAALP